MSLMLSDSVLEPDVAWAPAWWTARRSLETDGGADGGVSDFADSLLHVSKGIEAGRPVSLRAWQRWLLEALLERRPDGRRRYRRALVGLPRKNGKSLLGSILGLHGLVEGGLGAEVYSAAGDRQQARVVFDEARWQVQNSELAGILKVYRNVIEYPETGSIYRVLSADGKLQQGLNPSLVIFDEVHVQPDDELWDAMTLGSGARVDPLVVGITTAGFDLESLCGRLFQYGRQVAAGEVDDPAFGFFWWQAPEGTAYDDRDSWYRANPGLGDFLDVEDMEASAKQTPETSFNRFRRNMWTRSQESWLPPGAWQQCFQAELELPDGVEITAAVDMALYHDDAAVAVVWELPDGRRGVKTWTWQPGPDGIDVADIMQHIRSLADRYRLRECTYDPRFFDYPASVLRDEGIWMTEFPQTAERMVPACNHAYQTVVARQLAHDGDPTLEDHVLSAAQRPGERGWTLSKGKSKRKIDACIAMVLALWRASQPDVRSVYDQRGLLTL